MPLHILRNIFSTSKPAPPTVSQRQKIAQDTISRSKSIVQEHAAAGASLESTFIADQLPALDPAACHNFPASKVKVVNADSFTVAREIIRDTANVSAREEGKVRVAVLNLASDAVRAGGWERSLSKTQEEALCYSSTLYATLKPSYYPWPNLGPGSIAGVFSPGVVIFRDDLDHGCVELKPSEHRVVSVITVAAPRYPKLTDDEAGFRNAQDLEDMRGKIRLVYRMAAQNGQEYLVLGAMGCGAYRCPPRLVAEEMKTILSEPEFKGWFRHIIFAVYSKEDIGESNFDIFNKAFKNVSI